MENYDNIINKILSELTVADAGIGGLEELPYTSSDTYAPGDNRLPKVLGKIISRKGVVKKKRKKRK